MAAPMTIVATPPFHDIAPSVLALKPRSIWRLLTAQPISVLAVYAYLFFEYVRPQSIYPALSILPWARLSLLTAVFSALAQGAGKRKWTKMDGAIAAYTLVVFASLVTAFDSSYGLERLDVYLSWVAVYWLISTSINTQSRVFLMVASWLVWNLKMSQHATLSWASDGFAFRSWGASGSPGWFANSGEFGIEMCIFFPISLYFAVGLRKHVSTPVFLALLVLPATAIVGAVASSSRGALVGCGAVGLWILARSRYKVRGTIALALTVLLAWALTPDKQKERFSSAGEDGTSTSRLLYWERGIQFANQHPMLGIGYENWMPYYRHVWESKLEGNEIVQLPHNIFIQAVSELGYSGLTALLVLILLSFFLNARTRSLARTLGQSGSFSGQLAWGFDGALVGYMASGFFVTVLYYPYLWVGLGMTVALHLSVARAVRATKVAGGAAASLARSASAR